MLYVQEKRGSNVSENKTSKNQNVNIEDNFLNLKVHMKVAENPVDSTGNYFNEIEDEIEEEDEDEDEEETSVSSIGI